MYWLILLSKMISFGSLMSRSFNEIRKQTTNAELFLNWQLLIIVNWMQNFVYYFVAQPYYLLLFFLIVKLFVAHLPTSIHVKIHNQMKKLHFEVVYDILRCKILNTGFKIHMANTSFLLGLLDEQEARAFKDAVIARFQGQNSEVIQLTATPKSLESKYIQCGINPPPIPLTSAYVPPPTVRAPKEERFQPKYPSEVEAQQVRTIKSPTAQSAFKKAPLSPEYVIEKPRYSEPAADFYQPDRISSRTAFPVTSSKYTDSSDYRAESARRSANSAAFHSLSQRSGQLIDELNVEVSQYSNMEDLDQHGQPIQPEFYSRVREERRVGGPLRVERTVVGNPRDIRYVTQQVQQKRQDSPLGRLIAKAESYIQMGSKAYPRLEKYYVELYPNDKMQIISLHGRVFEKHILRLLVPVENDYYEAQFLEDEVPNARVLKFKTDMGEFARYIHG